MGCRDVKFSQTLQTKLTCDMQLAIKGVSSRLVGTQKQISFLDKFKSPGESSRAYMPAKRQLEMLIEAAIPADCALLCAVYFVQGILGLSRLGVSFLYKDEFHLEPASVSLSSSASHMLLLGLCPIPPLWLLNYVCMYVDHPPVLGARCV